MKKVFIAVVVILLVAVVAIAVRKPKKPVVEDRVSKSNYIIVDDSCCAHLTGCIMMLPVDGVQRVHYIDTAQLHRSDFEWYCPKCIKEKEYAHIQAIIKRNDGY